MKQANLKNNNKNYADYLQENEAKIITEDRYYDMLYCLPPQLTNYKKNRGSTAFLFGEPYTHKFCNFADRVVAFYKCFAVTSDNNYLEVGLMSEAEFIKKFINRKF